jgi:hypothetical protein
MVAWTTSASDGSVFDVVLRQEVADRLDERKAPDAHEVGDDAALRQRLQGLADGEVASAHGDHAEAGGRAR